MAVTHITSARSRRPVRLGKARMKTLGAAMMDITDQYERFAALIEGVGLSASVLRGLNDGLTDAFDRIDAALDPVGAGNALKEVA